MKKFILYSLMLCGVLCLNTACSEEYEDASAPHVYGPNENPPVVSTPANTATLTNSEMQGGAVAPVSVLIDNYAEQIQNGLGMSVSELMSAIESGKVVVCPINASRAVWNKAKPNVEGKQYAWYVNKNGNVCEAGDAALYGIIEFDAANRCFNFYADANAGGAATIEYGFALDGINYNTAVRFVMPVTIYDKSFAMFDVTVPAGDYAAYELNFADAAENINFVFGMTPDAFASALSGGELKLYMMNRETNAYIWDGTSTANSGGYWCDYNNNICAWGAEGYTYFIEPWIGDGSASFAVGRAPGVASGANYMIKFGVANADQSKMLSFFVNATFE